MESVREPLEITSITLEFQGNHGPVGFRGLDLLDTSHASLSGSEITLKLRFREVLQRYLNSQVALEIKLKPTSTEEGESKERNSKEFSSPQGYGLRTSGVKITAPKPLEM